MKKRQSNIEALRLLCMLMVLNLHSFRGYEHGSGLLQALDFFRESTSICAVDAFVLISGFFGIRWKWKSFFNLAFQVFFYSFTISGIAIAMNFIDFSKSSFLQCFKALCGSWTFIANYVVLYFLSPLLNAYSDSVNKKNLLYSSSYCFSLKILSSSAISEPSIFALYTSSVDGYARQMP